MAVADKKFVAKIKISFMSENAMGLPVAFLVFRGGFGGVFL